MVHAVSRCQLIVAAVALVAVASTAAPAHAQLPPRDAAIEELLELHARHHTAHLLGSADLMVGSFADTVVELRDGHVSALPREALRERFARYFAAVRFLEWDAIEPPRIALSPDGAWAEMLVSKRVRTIPAVGGELDRAHHFAWVERWRRAATGEWRLATIASTEMPAPGAAFSPDARRRALEILQRARAALGGDSTVHRLHTVAYRASCEGPRGPFTTEVNSTRDGRFRFVQRLPDRVAAVGRDHAGSWAGLPAEPVDSLDAVTRSVVAAHEFHLLAVAPEARYSNPRAEDRDTLDGALVDVVAFDDPLGAPARFFYDARSGLPAGFRTVNHTGRGPPNSLARFSDWRVVNGVRLPHRIEIRHGADLYTYSVTEARGRGASPSRPGR